MNGFTLVRLIVMPQMLRFAVAGLGNIWIVLAKATSLVSVIQLDELKRSSDLAASATRKPFTFYMVAAVGYLIIYAVSLLVLRFVRRRAFRGNEVRA